MRPRLTVVVPTYKRPSTLSQNLDAVLAQARSVADDPVLAVDVDVLVVDNDGAASARTKVEGRSSDRLRYVVEAEPGITAARNRGLDECVDSDLLAFVDDDETPEPEWLAHLVRTWAITRPAAVMGRVVSSYESEPDPWILAGRFFVRVRRETGTEIDVAACGNLLLDLQQVRALGIRFDPRFGLTGGEDTMFSRQLRRRGGRIVWCDESVAVDVVPDDRANRSWVLERARRSGNSSSLIDVALAAPGLERSVVRLRALVGGLLRLGAGRSRHVLGLLLRAPVHQARGLRTASRGLGMLDAAGGRVIEEYARDA